MQPGKGLGSTKESLSRCGEADIFSHIQYPQRKTVITVKLSELDTLGADEASQEARFLNQLLDPERNKFLGVLLKGGKFLFKGLLFPMRFFLFRLPKWVIVKLSPKIALINKKLNESKENFSKLIQNIAAKLNVLAAISQSLKPFSALLKTSLNKLAENFLSPFKKIEAFTKEKFQTASDLINKAFGLAESLFYKMQKLLTKSFKFAKSRESLYAKSFDFKKPLQKAYSRLITSITCQFAKLQNKMDEQLKKVKGLFDAANKAFAKRTKPVVDAVKNQLQSALNQYNRIKNKCFEFVTPKVEAMQQQLQKALEVFKPPVYAAFALIQGMNEKAVQIFLRNPMLQKIKSQCASLKRMTVKLQKAHTALLKSFQRLKKDAENAFKKWVRQIREKTKKYTDNQKKRIMWIVKKGLILFKKFKDFFIRSLKKFTRFFLAFFKWCRIMIKFTLYLIKEIVREAI